MQALLRSNARADAADSDGCDPACDRRSRLHGRKCLLVCCNSRAKAARASKVVRRFGSRSSVSAPCRWTALHYASRNGHTESVKALLGKGAAVNAETNAKCAFPCVLVLDGRRLHAGQGCARFGSRSSVSAPCRETALHYASSNGSTESVKALLEKGADVNAETNTKCAFACVLVVDGRRLHALGKAVRHFCSWLSVSAACRDTALHLASKSGSTESVKALLEKGAAVNAETNAKCAFSCCLCWMGDGCTRRARLCAFRVVVERVGAMQMDGAALRIIRERPHGEREGAAREGRGRERRDQKEVRVSLCPCIGRATAAGAGNGRAAVSACG